MYSNQPIYSEPTFWLSFLYLATAGVIIWRLVIIRLRKYRWLSYNTGFLTLCLLTCILRTACFMFWNFWMDPKRHIFGLSLYWFPTNVQFATFSLLVVFYASITNPSNWNRTRIPIWITYGLFNLLFLAAFIASLLVMKLDNVRDKARSIITATTFLILVVALGYYGFRVWRILLTASHPDPKLHGVSPLKLSVATGHIMVIYLSRAIYSIVSDVVPSFSLFFGTAGENITSEILSAGYITVWEIVPTVIILILFWGTTPNRNSYRPMQHLPYLNSTYAINDEATEPESEDYEYQPVSALYNSSSSITTYATSVAHGTRDSTSLLPHLSNSEVVASYDV